MGWLDSIKGAVGSAVTQAEGNIAAELLGGRTLDTILEKLRAAGLGDQVQSWLDAHRGSLPITAEQLRTALGNEYVQSMATRLGIPLDRLLALLATALPVAAAEQADDPTAAPTRQ